jgi:hypothetical protein
MLRMREEPRQTRFDICQHFYRCGIERDAFLDRIITDDETWSHHCEQETERQSME